MNTKPAPHYVLWFKDIGKDDIPIVGGKGANLGEMYSHNIPVPNGFVVTSEAYFEFIKVHHLVDQIRNILALCSVDEPDQLQQASLKVKALIASQPIPEDIAHAITKAYQRLSGFGGLSMAQVAVRSSATAEDLPDASFAGQQETFLNVWGETNLIHKVRACWASLFTPRAIFYREKKGFNHFKIGIAVPVQKMVKSKVSGVMFTINPATNNKQEMVIESVWGLGEAIVQGSITPDQYLVDKASLTLTFEKKVRQTTELIYAKQGIKKQRVPTSRQTKPKLVHSDVLALAKIGQKLHNHYQKPQDIEWAMEKGKLFIVQTRPITTVSEVAKKINQEKFGLESLSLLVEGQGASPGLGFGKAKILSDPSKIRLLKKGEVLVTDMTTPDFVPAMKIASAIVTNKGGQTSHAAIVSRELGVPCVVGCKVATKKINTGDMITVDGEDGKVYAGQPANILQAPVQLTPAKHLKTATKLYVNLAEPELAEEIAKRQVDGVGLLRAEFIMAHIGTHPKKMIKDGKSEVFINHLSHGIKTFCQSFHPRPVVYRATDFKTNEYRHLIGGEAFEPKEANPMLGFRGAVRYLSDKEVFSLELEAIKRVRNTYGLKNLWLMIPFIHTTQELGEIKKVLAAEGLPRSPSFKLWMMVEIPSNVILIDSFIKLGIDGVSIGSNDLTMLTLGIDRDNQDVAPYFNEQDPAVLWALKRTITHCKNAGVTSSICGQAPSNYPDLVEKLVRWGITSISVSPDAITRTREIIHEAEKRVVLHKP